MKKSLKNLIKKLEKPIVKNLLSALAIAVFGFILLNLTFLFDALYQGIIRGIIGIFIPLRPELELRWFPPLMHFSFVVIIGIVSWFIFKSRLKEIYKAIYMTVPVAVVLATVGMFLYRWQILSYSIGSLFCIGTLYYFYRTKQPWLYYYTVVLVGLTMGIFTLLGGEI
jgi:hypothetical protein